METILEDAQLRAYISGPENDSDEPSTASNPTHSCTKSSSHLFSDPEAFLSISPGLSPTSAVLRCASHVSACVV